MMTALALSLSYAGFAALALAMRRHHRQIWNRDPTGGLRHVYRAAGVLLLGLAFAACVVDDGWLIGPVTWFAVLSASALLFDFILPYAPRAAATVSLLTVPVAAATFWPWL
jgi:hypothetical protein